MSAFCMHRFANLSFFILFFPRFVLPPQTSPPTTTRDGRYAGGATIAKTDTMMEFQKLIWRLSGERVPLEGHYGWARVQARRTHPKPPLSPLQGGPAGEREATRARTHKWCP